MTHTYILGVLTGMLYGVGATFATKATIQIMQSTSTTTTSQKKKILGRMLVGIVLVIVGTLLPLK